MNDLTTEKNEIIRVLDLADDATVSDDYELPSYHERGRMLVRYYGSMEDGGGYRKHDAEVLCYDNNSCVFWINEGVGCDYWLDENVEFTGGPGDYVIEGILGHYHKGYWGFDDDTEEWEFTSIRKATEEESKTEMLT